MRVWWSVLTAGSLLFTGCGGEDESSPVGGSVAADEARIELSYAGDTTSYTGDRRIVEGEAVIVFSNDSDAPVTLQAFGYDTGSSELAEELEFLQEGESGVPSGVDPATPAFDTGLMDEFGPGRHTLTIDLRPGTYVFDAAPGDVMTTGLSRIAFIEIVAESPAPETAVRTRAATVA